VTRSQPEKIRVGVSSCLLGQAVRFDGGHKRDRFLLESLGPLVEWVPVCPEVELGLGTPRHTLRLERRDPDGEIRLVMPKAERDLTREMSAFSLRRARALGPEDLSGYVFKKDSPSCGLHRVKVYAAKGGATRSDTGLFAQAVTERFPFLPVEEEGRLQDARLRENFVTHLLAFRRWQALERAGPSRQALMRFHQLHKFTLMARSQEGMRRLGRLLGTSDRGSSARALAREYLEGFTRVMRRAPTHKGHTNVLQHVAGFVSRALDGEDRRELSETIEQYRRELVPLIVPITLIRHWVRKQRERYLSEQVYLYASPHELMLLNRI
jgi:uncharacterized protein YbgA (DUF1722 family)/uncharacterized protein YbbK (DUF523 family)